jgi:beta-mannosidase
MFVSHYVEVTSLVNAGSSNILEILFDSAQVRGRQVRKEHPEHNFIGHLGEVERLGIRKAPYHWGWDWGPKFMTAGPWRPVRLERYSSRVEDVWIEYSLDDDLEDCKGTISARVDGHADEEIRLALRDPKGNLVFEVRCALGPKGLVRIPVSLQKVSLWNPHGYGHQHRYFLDAELFRGDHPVHLETRRVGFRRAELIQELDIYGKSFYFRVNGVDIFAGGSNWIPADSFTPRISPEKYKQWMALLVEGNQIMTRYALGR